MSAASRTEPGRAPDSACTTPSRNGQRIGGIGIGRMGAPMLRNLARAGYALTVWARRSDAAEAFVHRCHETAGNDQASPTPIDIDVAPSLEALVEICDIIVLNVSDTADVRGLVERIAEHRKTIKTYSHSSDFYNESETKMDDRVMHRPRGARIIIDHSTIDPIATGDIAAQAEAQGIAFVDAPVSGGVAGAGDATLTVFLGGHADVVERIQPMLEAVARTVTHIGPIGSGQIAKACNQHLVGTALLALGDILALCEQADVDPRPVRDALLGGFAQSRVLDLHGARLLEQDLQPGFTVQLHAKDAAIVNHLFETLGLSTARTAAVGEALEQALANGCGDRDSRIIAADIVAAAKIRSS